MSGKRDRQIWERKRNPSGEGWKENIKRYEAFAIYRDLGRKRSLSQVSNQLNKSLTLMGRWSTQDDWVIRAQAYDEYMDQIAAQSAVEEAQEMGKRHVQEGKLLQVKGIEKLKSLKPRDITPRLAIQMIKLGVNIERLARGEPTLISDNKITEVSVSERMQKYESLFEGIVTTCNVGDNEDDMEIED